MALLWPGGTVLFQKLDRVDILELRRTILANVPSDYVGFNKYLEYFDSIMDRLFFVGSVLCEPRRAGSIGSPSLSGIHKG